MDMQNRLPVLCLLGSISTKMLFKAMRLDKSMSEGEKQAVVERIWPAMMPWAVLASWEAQHSTFWLVGQWSAGRGRGWLQGPSCSRMVRPSVEHWAQQQVGVRHVLRTRHPDVNAHPLNLSSCPTQQKWWQTLKRSYAQITQSWTTAFLSSVFRTERVAQDRGTHIASYMPESTEG